MPYDPSGYQATFEKEFDEEIKTVKKSVPEKIITTVVGGVGKAAKQGWGTISSFFKWVWNTRRRRRERRRKRREWKSLQEAFASINGTLSTYREQYLKGARLTYCEYIRGLLVEDIYSYNALFTGLYLATGPKYDPYSFLDDPRLCIYVAEAMREVISRARDMGWDVRVAGWAGSAFRTEQQSQKYHNENKGSAPGRSWHNVGMAVDLVIYNEHNQPMVGEETGVIKDHPAGLYYPYNILSFN